TKLLSQFSSCCEDAYERSDSPGHFILQQCSARKMQPWRAEIPQAQQGSRKPDAPGSSRGSCSRRGPGPPSLVRYKTRGELKIEQRATVVRERRIWHRRFLETVDPWSDRAQPCMVQVQPPRVPCSMPVLPRPQRALWQSRLQIFVFSSSSTSSQDLHDKSTNEGIMLAAQTAILPCENLGGLFPQTRKPRRWDQPLGWSAQSHHRAPHPFASSTVDLIYKLPRDQCPSALNFKACHDRYQVLLMQIICLDAARGNPTRRTEDTVPLSCRTARAHWPAEYLYRAWSCFADLLSHEPHELALCYSHVSRVDASACCDRASVLTSHRIIICHIRLPLQARTPPRPLLLVTWANGTRGSKRNNLVTQLSASRYVSPDEGTMLLCRQADVVPDNEVFLYSVGGHINLAAAHTNGRLYYTCYSHVHLCEKLDVTLQPKTAGIAATALQVAWAYTCATIDGRIWAKIIADSPHDMPVHLRICLWPAVRDVALDRISKVLPRALPWISVRP
ncbi:hypothetical protein CCMA1212_000567, partial [Trichoderma ghanense]